MNATTAADGSPRAMKSESPTATVAAVEPDSQTRPPNRVRSDIRTLKRATLAILVLLTIGVFYIAQDILIPIVLALLLALLLSPLVSGFERFVRLPRALGSLLVVSALVAILIYAVASLAQPAQAWMAHAPQTLNSIQQRLHDWREPIRKAQQASKTIDELTQPESTKTVVAAEPGVVSTMLTSMPGVLAEIASVLLLVYFFLSSGNGFLRKMVEVSPGLHEKRMVVAISREVQQEMSRYLVMVSLINFCLGAALAAILALLGVANPLLWGALAMVLNFAPYIGPACVIAMLALVGFTTFDSLGSALAVPLAFFILAVLEGQLITPVIIGRRLSLNPTVVFVWLLLWGWLWGIPGILLAGPLLACFRIVCRHVLTLNPIFVMIGGRE